MSAHSLIFDTFLTAPRPYSSYQIKKADEIFSQIPLIYHGDGLFFFKAHYWLEWNFIFHFFNSQLFYSKHPAHIMMLRLDI